MNEIEQNRKQKEIDIINQYFTVHKKIHDKRKQSLTKLKQKLTEEIADSLLEKYKLKDS